MAGPTNPFPTFSSADYNHRSEIDAALWTDLVNAMNHLAELTWGGGAYTGATPHDHRADGTAGTAIQTFGGLNLLRNGTPNSDTDWAWSRTGFADNANIQVLQSKTAGNHMEQDFPEKDMFGAGCDMVGSMFARSVDAQSQGEISFGLSDNGTTSWDSGFEAAIAYTTLTTSWQRFYARFPTGWASRSTNATFNVAIGTGFTSEVQVTGFMLSLGDQLTRFMYAPVDHDGGSSGGESHEGWGEVPLAPIFDYRVSMLDAVPVVPT